MKILFTKNWLILAGVAVVVLLLVFLNSQGFLGGAKNIFFKISSPLLSFFQNTSNKISDFSQSFLRTKDLKKENEILKIENLENLSQIVKLKEVERENKILREQFAGLINEETQIFARVRGFSQERTSIVINQGREQGILKDLPAVAAGNTVVGRVFEVEPDFSKVLLINSFQSQVAAMTSETRVKGILRGKGAQDYPILEMVSKEKEIKVGDKIITSGFDNIFPKGFLIGEITEVKKDDLEIFQEAKVRPRVDFDDLEEVFIITTRK